ncbi:ATP-binding protein [Streptomyces sp. NPDC051211]|uniref:ATP-binding protein n=1 Tax=Streptomyces sp. NPDC051211 TaxID=3154643 RepID=UPI00344CE613
MTPVDELAATPVHTFTQRFSATRRGARLARHLAVIQLADWGVPLGTGASDAAALVVAELVANAVTHGLVPGRDFELRIVLVHGLIRVEVSDARRDRRPVVRGHERGAEAGYGMRIVEAIAAGWGVHDRVVGKTVWAELPVIR